ncbi:MOSC domain-containing protein [Sulfurimonas sp. HSL3-2]|uniref:MOSC domain-containing protein n=1 Tax=Hydrocurvibacter mobilis TaxID=3131936 RepID=UPI0031F7CA70
MPKKILANVVELYVTASSDEPRVIKDELQLENEGVVGDKFYGKDMNRLILITSLDAYEMVKEKDIDIEHGSLGENILVNGSIKELNLGDRFNVGDVTLEITQNCTLCNGLSKINSKLPKLLKDDRGIFAKAVTCGTIKKGDIVYI